MYAFPNHHQGLSHEQIEHQSLQQPLNKQTSMNQNQLSLHCFHQDNEEFLH